jgi:hypothetical protein
MTTKVVLGNLWAQVPKDKAPADLKSGWEKFWEDKIDHWVFWKKITLQ